MYIHCMMSKVIIVIAELILNYCNILMHAKKLFFDKLQIMGIQSYTITKLIIWMALFPIPLKVSLYVHVSPAFTFFGCTIYVTSRFKTVTRFKTG